MVFTHRSDLRWDEGKGVTLSLLFALDDVEHFRVQLAEMLRQQGREGHTPAARH